MPAGRPSWSAKLAPGEKPAWLTEAHTDLGHWVRKNWGGVVWFNGLASYINSTPSLLRFFLMGARRLSTGQLYRLSARTGVPMEQIHLDWERQKAGLRAPLATRVSGGLPKTDKLIQRVYVATYFECRETAKAVAAKLEERGHSITHKWWAVEGDAPLGPKPWKQGILTAFHEHCAIVDVEAVKKATVVLSLVPPEGGTGMFVEMGVALGRNIPILTVGIDGNLPDVRSIFDALTRPMTLPLALEWIDTFKGDRHDG